MNTRTGALSGVSPMAMFHPSPMFGLKVNYAPADEAGASAAADTGAAATADTTTLLDPPAGGEAAAGAGDQGGAGEGGAAGAGASDPPAGETGGEGEGAQGQDDKGAAAVVPDEYADFTPVADFPLGEEGAAEIKGLAKTLGLTQEQAQKLYEQAATSGKATLDAQAHLMMQTRQGWISQVHADPEIGGANFPATRATAAKAFADFGSPALKQLMAETGLGNHPEIVRLFSKIGKAVSPDSIVVGDNGGGDQTQRKSHASILFGGG